MNPLVIVFVVGVACGALPVLGWNHYWSLRGEVAELKESARLEKRNVEIVTQYQDLLSGVSDWYQRNPVRVRIPSSQGSTACPSPSAEDIVLTVGGISGRDGGAANP